MDSFNSFFNNTNQNVQQDPYILQPFTPTPNPRSRFPGNLNRAPGLPTSHPEPFFNINVLPPDNDVPLLDFPNSQESQFSSDIFQSISHVKPRPTQSQPSSLPISLSIPQTLQVPKKASVHYKLQNTDHKMQPRKKGYSVGNNERESSESGQNYMLPNRRSEGSPTEMGIGKQPYRKSFGETRSDRVASFEQQSKSMNALQIPLISPRSGSGSGFEENMGEQILASIEENQINTVSMLNEVSSKIKKRVEYSINETPVGKNRVFECICFMEKDKIGIGKGNSKQAAKTEAAKAAICTLVTKDIYANEGHAILLSIQKANSQTGSYSPSMASKSNSRSNLSNAARSTGNIASDVENSPCNSIGGDDHNYSTCTSQANNDFDSKADHMNDSPLYELNVIAKECFIEPKWTLSPQPDQNGEFEVELRFDKLLAYGKGKKKQDAKRDAAIKIIKQIRSDSDLNQKFNPKSKKVPGKVSSASESMIGDRHQRFFDEYTSFKIFDDSRNTNFNSKDDIKKKKQDLESYLVSLGQKCKIENSIRDFYYHLLKKISDYTSMAASSTKQVLMHAHQHVADYINNTYLVPVGSFALGSIRADKLIADCIMIFEEVKEIEEADFIRLYQQALEECQILDNQSNTNYTPLNCKFSIKTSDLGLYLEVATEHEASDLKLNIYIFNSTKQQKQLSPSVTKDVSNLITHVRQIYNTFEHSVEDLSSFRILLAALRIWRDKHSLSCLRSEILDILLLNEFLTNKLVNISPALNNCLLVLSSDEVLKSVLSRFGNFYEELYQEMSQDEKSLIQKVSSQSLNSIFQGNFAPIKFQ